MDYEMYETNGVRCELNVGEDGVVTSVLIPGHSEHGAHQMPAGRSVEDAQQYCDTVTSA